MKLAFKIEMPTVGSRLVYGFLLWLCFSFSIKAYSLFSPTKTFPKKDSTALQNAKQHKSKTLLAEAQISLTQTGKYLHTVDKKITTYQQQISQKTKTTLERLAKWELKVKTIVEKSSPSTAARLFNAQTPSFASLLAEYTAAEKNRQGYQKVYQEYSDKLGSTVKYIENQAEKLDAQTLLKSRAVTEKMGVLNLQINESEALAQAIKQRKKELLQASINYLKNSKLLSKIDKQSYYYVESLANYKALFSDEKKIEQTVKTILNKLPAYQKFIRSNSMLANIFGTEGEGATAAGADLSGLQTRASVSEQLQAQTGMNAEAVQQHLQDNAAINQAQLQSLLEKALTAAGVKAGDAEVPNFVPKTNKSKTLKQKIVLGLNIQSMKSNTFLPTTTQFGGSVGYKLNDKSLVGIGAAYTLGWGSWNAIQLSHQGIGLRSFMDWRLKQQWFVTGGFEMNYNQGFRGLEQLRNQALWQRSGLIGITKKISAKTKLFKGFNLQLLYDILAYTHIPTTQPLLFRVGYNF